MKLRLQTQIQRLMLTLFVTLWIVGNVMVVFEVVLRTASLRSIPQNLYVVLMEAFGGREKFYHPHYYMQLQADFLLTVREVPLDETVYVLVHETDPQIDPLEYYSRFWRVWAYPRRVVFLVEPISARLQQIPINATIITLNIPSLPDRHCSPEAGAFALCR